MSVTMTDLREALKARGLSIREAARRTSYDHAYLSRVINGQQVPSADLLAALERLLGTCLVEPTRDSLAASLAKLRRAEDSRGVESVRSPVANQARLVVNVADDATGPGRQAMAALAGQWTTFAGWISLASGERKSARNCFDRASEYAAESDDQSLMAHVLSFKGYAAGLIGNPWAMEGLTAASLRVTRVHPGQETYNHFQHARALADIGESQKAGSSLDAAVKLIDHALTEEPPPYAYWYNRPFFIMNAGLTHARLGHASMAADLLEDGLADLPNDMARAEWVEVFRVALEDSTGNS